jgi:hypothetical protein
MERSNVEDDVWWDQVDAENLRLTRQWLESIRQEPSVLAVRYQLSPYHRGPDIETLLANANLFGLGAGVFPIDHHPYPPVRRCLSFLTAVMADEVPKTARSARETAVCWLSRQPEPVRSAVLASAPGLRAPLLPKSYFRIAERWCETRSDQSL